MSVPRARGYGRPMSSADASLPLLPFFVLIGTAIVLLFPGSLMMTLTRHSTEDHGTTFRRIMHGCLAGGTLMLTAAFLFLMLAGGMGWSDPLSSRRFHGPVWAFLLFLLVSCGVSVFGLVRELRGGRAAEPS